MKVIDPIDVPYINDDPNRGRNWALYLREVQPHTEIQFYPCSPRDVMLIRSAIQSRRNLLTGVAWKTRLKGETLTVRRTQ